MTKEQLIFRIEDIDSSIKKLEVHKSEYIKMLKEHSPIKVGQKAKYVRVQTRRTKDSDIFNPKYEKVAERTEILVCVAIRVTPDYKSYRYQLKRLKSDGTLTQNDVHVDRDELEWLDELYEFPK